MKTLYSSHLSSGDKLLKIIEDSKINAKTYLSNLNKKQKKKRKKLFRKLIRRKMKRIKKQRHSSSTSQPIPEENCSIDEGESPNSDMSNSSPSLDNQSTLDDELIDEIDNEVFQHLWKKKLRFETNKGASKSMSSYTKKQLPCLQLPDKRAPSKPPRIVESIPKEDNHISSQENNPLPPTVNKEARESILPQTLKMFYYGDLVYAEGEEETFSIAQSSRSPLRFILFFHTHDIGERVPPLFCLQRQLRNPFLLNS